MSRCFPFPRSGYGARDEALIESIKLRKEIEKAKKDRKEKKEKKREKKEKRKEKKESKHKEGTTTSHGSDDGKKLKLISEIKESKADGRLQKGEDCENEQHERSGITEELDQPVTSLEPCCLSDSTQSSKRKRSSPQASHDHGPAIKIRLPLRKHRDPEELKSKPQFQVGSSSGSVGVADSLTKNTLGNGYRQLQCPTNTEPKQVLGNSDSRHCKVVQNLVHGDAVVTKKTLGSDRQLQYLAKSEPKRVLGNSDSRHGKAVQNLVHGDAVVSKNTLGSDRQSQYLPKTEPKRVLGNADYRHCKAVQNIVHGGAVVTKNTLGSDRQLLQCFTNTETKRVLGNSDSRHGKAMQNLVPGDVFTNNAVADESQKVASLYKSLLQIPPLTYDGLDSVDQDWLFSSEPREARPGSKKQKTDSDMFQLSKSVWPRAQYLPEVEVYALPYAVPF
ncbi:kinesin-related protein 12 [Spatholobus suberectus]|nr:kinesin-related protein 12 [Spatholobus suberectus]